MDKNTCEGVCQFLINISQQKLLDKVLVSKEIWSIFYSLEEHKENSIESDILHKIFNSEYNSEIIPFYVQSRKILTQIVFGDLYIGKNKPLENTYIDADQAANASQRIFERVIPERGLSTSTGNVIRNLDFRSYNSQMEMSTVDFLHFILLEYQRLQLKAYHDDEIKYNQKERKLKEITVPPIEEMFYKDPQILIRNFDYENAVYIPQENMQNISTDLTILDMNDTILRIGVPASKFQNNPPKTLEEQRRERK